MLNKLVLLLLPTIFTHSGKRVLPPEPDMGYVFYEKVNLMGKLPLTIILESAKINLPNR